MKQCIAIILATLILLLSTQDVSTYIAFKINQEFMANNWCVNINNPELNCCGKCFLTKEITSNTEEKKDPLSIPSLQEVGKQNIYYTDWIPLLKEESGLSATPNFSYKTPISHLRIYNLLQPPDIFPI